MNKNNQGDGACSYVALIENTDSGVATPKNIGQHRLHAPNLTPIPQPAGKAPAGS